MFTWAGSKVNAREKKKKKQNPRLILKIDMPKFPNNEFTIHFSVYCRQKNQRDS